MHYLTPEEILILHARIIDATGGAHGVRDLGRILSASQRPKVRFVGKDLYRTIFDKAAAYFESITFDHPFVGGNKRTGLAVAARFLFLNGHVLVASNKALEKFAVNAVVKKYTKVRLSKWFKEHANKR